MICLVQLAHLKTPPGRSATTSSFWHVLSYTQRMVLLGIGTREDTVGSDLAL